MDQVAQADEIEALFVQSAQSMAYDSGRLTLNGVAPTTLMFSDRPERVTGHVPTDELLDSWGDVDNSFADNPPQTRCCPRSMRKRLTMSSSFYKTLHWMVIALATRSRLLMARCQPAAARARSSSR